MRFLVLAAFFGASVAGGCARHRTELPPANSGHDNPAFTEPVAAGMPNQRLIVTPESTLVGKVARINTAGRFVVLSFPIGRLPAMDQRLNVYRLGLKVGEVKVTGPQLDDNVVADLATGDASPGDEVRDK